MAPTLKIPRRVKMFLLLVGIIGGSVLAGYSYGAATLTQQTSGHIRIVNGSSAGLLVTPAFLDFGNVQVANDTLQVKGISVGNTGDCIEHVTGLESAVSSPSSFSTFVGAQPQNITIGALQVHQVIPVTLSWNVTSFPLGDYTFNIDWVASCV